MPDNGYVPLDAVRQRLNSIDARLNELKRESVRIQKEEDKLLANKAVLAELERNAVASPNPRRAAHVRRSARGKSRKGVANTQRASTNYQPPRTSHTRHGVSNDEPKPSAGHKAVADGVIPDGRIATPIILDLIRDQPGIKSIEVIDKLHDRVAKKINKGPRRFLSDLIWELRHRKKLRREPDGGLYILGERGGTA